jgi:hypothetical protein
MSSLVGAFIVDEIDEVMEKVVLYGFRIIFSNRKSKVFYFSNKKQKDRWF